MTRKHAEPETTPARKLPKVDMTPIPRRKLRELERRNAITEIGRELLLRDELCSCIARTPEVATLILDALVRAYEAGRDNR